MIDQPDIPDQSAKILRQTTGIDQLDITWPTLLTLTCVFQTYCCNPSCQSWKLATAQNICIYIYIFMYIYIMQTKYLYIYMHIHNIWLVVYLPLWKWWSSSVGMMTFPTEWKVIKFMFQTTNQNVISMNSLDFCWNWMGFSLKLQRGEQNGFVVDVQYTQYSLVRGIPTPLKNMSSSVFTTAWTVIKFHGSSHHQPQCEAP